MIYLKGVDDDVNNRGTLRGQRGQGKFEYYNHDKNVIIKSQFERGR